MAPHDAQLQDLPLRDRHRERRQRHRRRIHRVGEVVVLAGEDSLDHFPLHVEAPGHDQIAVGGAGSGVDWCSNSTYSHAAAPPALRWIAYCCFS